MRRFILFLKPCFWRNFYILTDKRDDSLFVPIFVLLIKVRRGTQGLYLAFKKESVYLPVGDEQFRMLRVIMFHLDQDEIFLLLTVLKLIDIFDAIMMFILG